MSKIIIADDNEWHIDCIKDLLTLEGHTVECARDGEEAIMIISEHVRNNIPIDLVITDMTMPKANGVAVAAAAKKAGAKKVIINSSYHADIPPMEGVVIINKMDILKEIDEL